MSQLCLYIIDDNEVDCLIATTLLKKHLPESHIQQFYTVGHALDRLQSLAIDSALAPSLILLDVHLPMEDGWVFLDRFIALPQYAAWKSKVVLLTASLHWSHALKAKEYAPVAHLIHKPLRSQTILHTIVPLLQG